MFLSWALLGIWSLVCNWFALKDKLLPKTICYIGILGSCLYFLVFLGSVVQKQLIVDIAVGVGGLIIGPIWYIWFGLAIKRSMDVQILEADNELLQTIGRIPSQFGNTFWQ